MRGSEEVNLDRSTIFVPGPTAKGSVVIDGAWYPLNGVRSARGYMNKHGGSACWGGFVQDFESGKTKALSGQSQRCFTYGNHEPVSLDGPK